MLVSTLYLGTGRSWLTLSLTAKWGGDIVSLRSYHVMPALGLEHVTVSWQHEKIEQRGKERNVTPTSFLWSAYYPNRYYFEVCLPVWGLMDGDLIMPLS